MGEWLGGGGHPGQAPVAPGSAGSGTCAAPPSSAQGGVAEGRLHPVRTLPGTFPSFPRCREVRAHALHRLPRVLGSPSSRGHPSLPFPCRPFRPAHVSVPPSGPPGALAWKERPDVVRIRDIRPCCRTERVPSAHTSPRSPISRRPSPPRASLQLSAGAGRGGASAPPWLSRHRADPWGMGQPQSRAVWVHGSRAVQGRPWSREGRERQGGSFLSACPALGPAVTALVPWASCLLGRRPQKPFHPNGASARGSSPLALASGFLRLPLPRSTHAGVQA